MTKIESKKPFKSGKQYTFKDLFGQPNNGKIIIPDLQRDYCWGDNEVLVSSFVDTIISNKDSELILGLIYGYYEDVRPNVQLCDGQQRLTTLFLLVGLINKMCAGNPFGTLLMSDYERNNDDMEPRLLYGIRDSSLFFLSDLVYNYFLSEDNIEDEPSKEVMNSKFWTESYETDPTITSILKALDIIYERLKKYNDSLEELGENITTKLNFVFYDMGGRKNGEETFVVINRTGEPLTATENLKPKIITKDEESKWADNSQKWEEIDNWLWRIRNKDQNDTSDNGMKEFLRIVAGLYPSESIDEDYAVLLAGDKENDDNYVFPTSIAMETIYGVYLKLKELTSNDESCSECELFKFPIEKKLQLNEYFILLPTLRHYIEFHNKLESKRIYRFFQNLTRYTTISTDNKNVTHAIKAIESMKSMKRADVISLLDSKDVNKAYILTEEEKLRLEVIRHQCYDKGSCKHYKKRDEIEEMFEQLSSMDIISGEIKGVLKWCCGEEFKAENVVLTNSDEQAQTNTFENYSKHFQQYFSDGGTIKTELALLAFGKLENYPIVNNTMWSLPNGKLDWDFVMKGCKENNLYELGNFLNEYHGASHDEYMSKHEKSSEVDKESSEAYETILKYCKADETDKDKPSNKLIVGDCTIDSWQRKFRVYNPNIIRVLNGYNATKNDVFLIDGEVIKASLDETFAPIWIHEYETVVLDCWNYNISFDSFKKGDEWVLQIFKRKNGRENYKHYNKLTQGFKDINDDTVNDERKEYYVKDVSKWLDLVKSKIELIKSYSKA